MSGFKVLVPLIALITLPAITPVAPAGGAPQQSGVIVFNAEANRLNAYDPSTGEKQTVIPSAADDARRGRDINGQICFDPAAPNRFIAGEDTNQPDPPAGWGYFQLRGRDVGQLRWRQLGKLTPTYVTTASNPENYGCGFLSDGRLVTSDVGDQLPLQPATGQLIVWFPPFDSFEVAYCKVDVAIPTAGGIHVDGQDRVYAAANRPGGGSLAGVYRYSGPLPTSNDASGGCGRTDATGAPLADLDRIGKELFILAEPLGALTPSAVAPSPSGGFYVSSVLTGVIAEYDSAGHFVRRVLQPPQLELVPPFSTGTPFGLGVDSSGTLYYADIGIGLVPPGPIDGIGTVRRIRFVGGVPQPPEVIDAGLDFPDGIGILERRD